MQKWHTNIHVHAYNVRTHAHKIALRWTRSVCQCLHCVSTCVYKCIGIYSGIQDLCTIQLCWNCTHGCGRPWRDFHTISLPVADPNGGFLDPSMPLSKILIWISYKRPMQAKISSNRASCLYIERSTEPLRAPIFFMQLYINNNTSCSYTSIPAWGTYFNQMRQDCMVYEDVHGNRDSIF